MSRVTGTRHLLGHQHAAVEGLNLNHLKSVINFDGGGGGDAGLYWNSCSS